MKISCEKGIKVYCIASGRRENFIYISIQCYYYDKKGSISCAQGASNDIDLFHIWNALFSLSTTHFDTFNYPI